MQRSEKQIIASRLNGAKSRGPITPEGKLRSCQNAIRHDAVALSITLEAESRDYFRENLDDLCNTWQPANLTEHKLIESMAVALWKKDRYELAEKGCTDERVAIERENMQPTSWPNGPVIAKAIGHLAGAERAIRTLNHTVALMDRQFIRNLNMLMKVQEYRRRYNPDQGPDQLDQSPMSPVMSPVMDPPAAIESEPAAIEPAAADLESADETSAPATTDAGPALTTLSAPKAQKRTHNVLEMNASTHRQNEKPELAALKIGANHRIAGGAAA